MKLEEIHNPTPQHPHKKLWVVENNGNYCVTYCEDNKIRIEANGKTLQEALEKISQFGICDIIEFVDILEH